MWNEQQIERLTQLEWPPTREFHARLGSTNDRARELLERRPPVELPALVVTAEQAGGRGRMGRHWWSPPGALLLSLAWPTPAAKSTVYDVPPVALWAGIGVADALTRIEPRLPVWLKWPNDIMTANEKLGGILVERATNTLGVHWIIGIGINVNNSVADARPQFHDAGPRYQPTSLIDLFGRPYQLIDVLQTTLQSLHASLSRWRDHPEELVTRWQSYCGLHGKQVRVAIDSQRTCQGTCCGVDPDGALRVQLASGQVATCIGGSVVAWR